METLSFLAIAAASIERPAGGWESPGTLAFKLLAVLLLVLMNGFFVPSEFAIVKVRASQFDAILNQGDRRAGPTRKVIENLDAYLSATQLGVTLASLALGWVGEPFVARSRYPLCAGDLDHMTGLIHLRDVFALVQESEPDLATIKKDLVAVPESMPLEQLLPLCRRQQAHLTVVVDEYGTNVGIVTLQHVVSKIIGEEVLDEGVTGFIVDNVEEAVHAVSRLDEIDRSRCRRVFEERFDVGCMAGDYLDVYRRVAGSMRASSLLVGCKR